MFDYDVIPRPKAAPQGGLSCPFGAIHLLGISWYSVIAAFYQEIATPYGLAMTNSEACCVKPISIFKITNYLQIYLRNDLPTTICNS